MRCGKLIILAIFGLSTLVIAGCSGGGGDEVVADLTNNAPIARAGNDQSATTGATVNLDGSGSSDANNDSLTYAWTITSKPAGSTVAISNATSAIASVVPDVDGSYIAQLIVNDGKTDSSADSVTITVTTAVSNTSPVANAGADQSVSTGATVSLSGSSSSDAESDTLTYSWSLTGAVPAGSTALISNATSVNASFVPDFDGTYTISLIVNDGTVDSVVDTMVITATSSPTTAFFDISTFDSTAIYGN